MSPSGSLLSFIAAFSLASCASAMKYREWLHWYDRDGYLTNLSTITCNETLRTYTDVTQAGRSGDAVYWCYLHEDCLLEHIRPSYLQNYQSAAVILGVMPTLLATLGPRIGEISLLSTHRPVLSFLLSVGAPGVWPTRIFTYDDPGECLGRGVNRFCVKKQPHRLAVLYSILEYAMAGGAIVNLFHVAITLGRLTVMSWSCTFDYGPLAWALIPLSIHFVAGCSYKFEISRTEKEILKLREEGVQKPSSPLERAGTELLLQRSITFIERRRRRRWWQNELSICANQEKGMETLLKFKRISHQAVFLNCIASTMAFFHVWFGIILFSALLFAAVWDIMNSIFWRYLLSTVACRLILLYELAGLRDSGLDEVEELKLKVERMEENVQSIASASTVTGNHPPIELRTHPRKNSDNPIW